MSQKNTNYTLQLSLIPSSYTRQIQKINTQDLKQKIAHLVFLDMLQLIKM
jgi:hypothetical protein